MFSIKSEESHSSWNPVLIHWTISEKDAPASEEFSSALETLVSDTENLTLAADVSVERYKAVLKALGRNPQRYRISSDALIRRIRRDKAFPRVTKLVDVCNAISVQTGWPVGCYNPGKIEGEAILRLGSKGEVIPSLAKGDLDVTNLPILVDNAGPFGSPISDSSRAAMAREQREAVYVIYAYGPIDIEHISNTIDHFSKLSDLQASHPAVVLGGHP